MFSKKGLRDSLTRMVTCGSELRRLTRLSSIFIILLGLQVTASWTKYQFNDFVEKANVNIITKTLRANCNFMIVGNDGARVIRQLKPDFVPEAGIDKAPTGPYKLGTLNGRIVIHDPLIATQSKIIFGYRGDNYFMGGFIFAPYIPLFTTPTLLDGDLAAQKGFFSSAGYLVTNNGMFTNGSITGLS